MTVCRCGVEVRWCHEVGSDDLVPIESRVTLVSGPGRFAIVDYGERWTVKALDPNSRASGHPDHRTRCSR